MDYLATLIPIAAIVLSVLGLISVLACNGSHCPIRIYWGRFLYLLIFGVVASSCFVMAMLWPRGVLPTCLAMAVLFLGMLWTSSTPIEENDASS